MSLTLADARRFLLQHVEKGVRCPCCKQNAKIQKRNINASMARKLIAASRAFGPDWFHMPRFVRDLDIPGRDEGGLAYWGLIEASTERREDGGRSGWWRVTDRGRAFVAGTLTVPKYARVWDGQVLGFQGANVSIHDALGEEFDLRDLMSR